MKVVMLVVEVVFVICNSVGVNGGLLVESLVVAIFVVGCCYFGDCGAKGSGECVVVVAIMVLSLMGYIDMVVPGNGGSVYSGSFRIMVGEGVMVTGDCGWRAMRGCRLGGCATSGNSLCILVVVILVADVGGPGGGCSGLRWFCVDRLR